MRYQRIHAAPRDRVPSALWRATPLRATMSVIAASAVALVPALMVASPAQAAPHVQFALTAPSMVSEAATPALDPLNPPIQKTVTVTATLTGVSNLELTIPVAVNELLGDAAKSGGVDDPYRDLDNFSFENILIPAGQTSGTATVTLWDDALNEDPVQYFTVVSGVIADDPGDPGVPGTSAVPGHGTVRVGIMDDDPIPTVSIGGDSEAFEGNPLAYPVRLSGMSEHAVTVNLHTADGVNTPHTTPANAGVDYVTPIAPIVIPPITTSVLAVVDTLTDDMYEVSPEMLSVGLSDPTFATLGTPIWAAGSIDDMNTAPTAAIRDETIGEDEGSVDVHVDLTFDPIATISSSRDCKIPWHTVDGTATAGQDYTESHGVLTIPGGRAVGKVNVPITADHSPEPDEDFSVILDTPLGGCTLSDDTGIVTIHDVLNAPSIVAPTFITGVGSVPISGMASANTAVSLWAQPFSGGTWLKVGNTTSDGTGAFHFSSRISVGHNYVTKSEGLTSETKTVKVMQLPAVTVSSASKGTATVAVVGNPTKSGLLVIVQQMKSGKWVSVAQGSTNSSMKYTATVKGLKSKTSYTFRAYIAGYPGTGTLAGYSVAKTVTVK
jgi:Calx-beta domain